MTVSEPRAIEVVPSMYGALSELVAALVAREPWWSTARREEHRVGGDDGHGGGDGHAVPPDPAAAGAGAGAPGAGWPPDPPTPVVRSADVLLAGRPGLLDVVADVGAATVHRVLGLRAPGEESAFLPDADPAPLGVLDDAEGLAIVFDALTDASFCQGLLRVVTGADDDLAPVRRGWSSREHDSLVFDDRLVLTIFKELPAPGGPHPGLEMLLALDRVGFNRLIAPHAVWRRGPLDLGIVQDYPAGSTSGWALALTSLRDLYASGLPPDQAGGDFAVEARRLGTMTARLHLGLDEAFGRVPGDPGAWADAVVAAIRPVEPDLLDDPAVVTMLDGLRESTARRPAIRTHGDLRLGRVLRTDIGWFLADFSPGGPAAEAGLGALPGSPPGFRSPLADVADMLWSFHRVTEMAAAERTPSEPPELAALARAWEARNRRAYLSAYLATPGIGGLVPRVPGLVRALVAAFQLERAAWARSSPG